MLINQWIDFFINHFYKCMLKGQAFYTQKNTFLGAQKPLLENCTVFLLALHSDCSHSSDSSNSSSILQQLASNSSHVVLAHVANATMSTMDQILEISTSKAEPGQK